MLICKCSLVILSKKGHMTSSRMNLKSRNLLRSGLSACCLLLLCTPVIADSFVPPTGKMAPFRRDLLPINDRLMHGLSNYMTTITSGSPYETSEHRRAVAKALALALALDPQNDFPKNRLSKLIKGEKPDYADKDKIEREKKRIWDSLTWLSSPAAGKDGNLLATLMGETVAALYPSDPHASSYIGKPEHEAWDGWVAELTSFKKAPVIEEEPEIEEEKEEEKKELAITKPKIEKRKFDPKAGVVLEHAKISTVLRMYDKDKAMWLPKVVPLEMKGHNYPKDELGEDYHGFRLEISGPLEDYWQLQEQLSSPLQHQISNHFGQLPNRAEIKIHLDGGQTYPLHQNRRAISGAAFVLANAALSGSEPVGTVIGEIDRSGKLKLPAYSWRSFMMLMELEEGSGGRLIIPASAEPMLINLLAFGNPEFFFKYEVLVASSLEEFVTLASKNASAQHEEIYSKFKIIKEKSTGNVIGAYLTNKFVRERLQEIIDQAPYHLSAKMLSVHGSVARPRYLTREALAAEIWRTVDVISEIAKIEEFYGINSNQLAKLDEHYKRMRDDLRELERQTDTRNNDLLKEAKDLVSSVRNFGKEYEGKAEMWQKIDKITSAHRKMTNANKQLLAKLSELTSDPLPR